MTFPTGSASSPGQVAVWRALCDLATPGPWRHSTQGEDQGRIWVRVTTDDGKEVFTSCPDRPDCIRGRIEDLLFISHARQVVPALLDELERYERLVERLEADNTLLRRQFSQLRTVARGAVAGTIGAAERDRTDRG